MFCVLSHYDSTSHLLSVNNDHTYTYPVFMSTTSPQFNTSLQQINYQFNTKFYLECNLVFGESFVLILCRLIG